jgi:hypothetical protein
VPPGQHWCTSGLEQGACHRQHSWGRLPQGPGKGNDRECLVCRANFSINPADIPKVWIVGYCHGGCSPEVVRDALLRFGIDPLCLGRFGLPSSQPATAACSSRTSAATIAAANRWYAVDKLPAGLNDKLRLMCIQAIREGDGSLPGDHYQLLPVNQDDFIALAKRAGVDRAYAYRLYRKWLSS